MWFDFSRHDQGQSQMQLAWPYGAKRQVAAPYPLWVMINRDVMGSDLSDRSPRPPSV